MLVVVVVVGVVLVLLLSSVLSTQHHQQYTQTSCPSLFFILERYKFCGHRLREKTKKYRELIKVGKSNAYVTDSRAQQTRK